MQIRPELAVEGSQCVATFLYARDVEANKTTCLVDSARIIWLLFHRKEVKEDQITQACHLLVYSFASLTLSNSVLC